MVKYTSNIMEKSIIKHNRGFTLVESLLSAAIFVLLSLAVYETAAKLLHGIGSYRENVVTSTLADQYMEIVRNIPYSQIGSISGNPQGNLPDLPNAIQTDIDGVTYKIYYVVNYIDDPADGTILNGTDQSPNDYKQVKMYVLNTLNRKISYFLTNISPKNLEGLSSGGALFIKVFDSVGQPIPDASIHITNSVTNTNLTRTTDASGNWIEVNLPSSNNNYHITVTKNGYSTDQTYPITVQNPNPTKPDSTVASGEVTQISFSIDKFSSLSLYTLNQYCNPISGVGMEVRGSKLVGNSPEIFKFDNLYNSNSYGKISLQNMEWDNYTPGLTGSSYTIHGSSPIQQINILPNTAQNFSFILGPKTNSNLLVIVKDSSTNNPVEGAKVEISSNSKNFDNYKLTGGSVWSQESWTGGDGQINWADQTKYFEKNNLSTNEVPTALRLASYDGGLTYVSSGYLISSTFDTGTASTTFTNIEWQPASQNPTTSVKFQIATNNDNSTWDFLGPNGTSNTYYTVPGISINSSAAQYIRYKILLETSDPVLTPVITNVNINYVSGCFTPGQTIFTSLQNSSDYMIKVTKDGYLDQVIDNLNIIQDNPNLEILLSH